MLIKFFSRPYAVPAAAILFLFICYQLAFKKTLEAWQLHRQFQQQLSTAQGIGSTPALMIRKQRNLDRIVQHYRWDTTAYRSSIIEQISKLSATQGVGFPTLPQREPALQSDQLQVERVVLNGKFTDLLKTLHTMEQTSSLGVVRSVRLSSPDERTGKKGNSLEMSVYLMSVRK
ncbi:hypothetical protein CKK33_14575 [Mucilaginibacter sp. MD40]|uniref:hypothetical protein n=1 Tax=Mucilaginibacter sp. MD40 TaxID=2029590 RepID=UPI000BAC640D|nr:hypothetical protein [Mucilaginibacter sp. MD40]PAW94651.1 hypothetical protein CKK33_14575 [Mucilaginibacter sp. MD40]